MANSIVLSKIGSDHSFQGINKQDLGAMFGNVKISLDGCSSGNFSEIGVGLFIQTLSKRSDITAATFESVIHEEMQRLIAGLGFTDMELFDNFCFTIVACIEDEEEFTVFSCGDGYIFAITAEGRLEIINLDLSYNDMPPYYVYNFIHPDALSGYKDGVTFQKKHFSKEKYVNVGVGSDGYRFAVNLNNADQVKFEEALLLGKRGRIGQIINRNAKVFKDDITIVL